MKLYDVANSLPVKRNLTGPFLLTPWLDMSLSLIQDDYYWKRVECCVELLFGSSQRQFHSEQKIMESRSCGPDVHSPAMSTYIHTREVLLVFLPVNPLRSLKRPALQRPPEVLRIFQERTALGLCCHSNETLREKLCRYRRLNWGNVVC